MPCTKQCKKQAAMDTIFVNTSNLPDWPYLPFLVFASQRGLLPQPALLS